MPFGDYAEGHAVQVWYLLHLLPVILCDVVDVEHEAWRLCLLLREIVELICVPKVSDAQVLFLNCLVLQYTEARLELFPSVSVSLFVPACTRLCRSFHVQVIAHAEFIRQNVDGDDSRILNYLGAPFQDVDVTLLHLAAFFRPSQ